MRPTFLAAALAALTLPASAYAQAKCGGDFSSFIADAKAEAVANGADPAKAERFFASLRQDPAVLRADQAQGVFQKPFIEFSRRLISENRINRGRAMAEKYDAIFDRIEAEYGVSRGVLLAFWAFETDYGAFQGDFNTANALATLSHD
ncbi:lytic murein transglycosylase, partial [Sulfitobacter sp. HI0054]|uniref:lytic murein transglycosylase n=4 Tax=Sulfitobacter TaxID=60136 RepID=UPI000A441FE2